ncbi:hypothetical protein KCU92_g1052, partial [Aureobasidium melanogenum]
MWRRLQSDWHKERSALEAEMEEERGTWEEQRGKYLESIETLADKNKNRNEAQQAEIARLQEEVRTFDDTIAKKDRTIEGYQQRLKFHQDAISSKDQEIAYLMNQLMKQPVDMDEQSRVDVQALKSRILELENQASQLSEQNNALRKELRHLSRALTQAHASIHSLQVTEGEKREQQRSELIRRFEALHRDTIRELQKLRGNLPSAETGLSSEGTGVEGLMSLRSMIKFLYDEARRRGPTVVSNTSRGSNDYFRHDRDDFENNGASKSDEDLERSSLTTAIFHRSSVNGHGDSDEFSDEFSEDLSLSLDRLNLRNATASRRSNEHRYNDSLSGDELAWGRDRPASRNGTASDEWWESSLTQTIEDDDEEVEDERDSKEGGGQESEEGHGAEQEGEEGSGAEQGGEEGEERRSPFH